MSESLELFAALEKYQFLHILPVALLNMVVTYACIGPIRGRFVDKFIIEGRKGHPESIAFSEATGELLVLDEANAIVDVFSIADRTFVRSWSTRVKKGRFDTPRCVCVDQNTGHVFVSNRTLNRVQEFQLDGTFIRYIGKTWGRVHLVEP